MKKDETYIKGLLDKVFSGDGNFQRYEYCSNNTNWRADFVILGDTYFKYFEIKSEYDTLDNRLQNQFRGFLSVFTHFYLVIPRSNLEKVMAFGLPSGYYGIYLVEELEQGKKEPFLETMYTSSIEPEALTTILWADEIRYYVGKLGISVNGKPLAISKYKYWDLAKLFTFFYTDKDSLRILNEVLPTRKY